MPLIMGILNVTPDSFFPESRTQGCDAAVRRALEMRQEGADIIDIGGQSTRPGSESVPESEEIRRVMPVVEALASQTSTPISIDTDKAEVARLALEAGAAIVNDVSALRNDPKMAAVAAGAQAVILMHRGGDSPKTMQQAPEYKDVVEEVRNFLEERLEAFTRAGGDARKVWLDFGIGFGKDLGHNLSLIKHMDAFAAMGRPLVVGASRKSFLGRILAEAGNPVDASQRLEGSLAISCLAMLAGVKVLRVHDVKATRRVLQTLAAVEAAD